MFRVQLKSARRVACLSLLFSTAILAGDRELSHFGATNATRGDEPAISMRLFELFLKDSEIVLMGENNHGFGWRAGGKVKPVPCPDGIFKPMIIPSTEQAVADLIEKHQLRDGLLVYEYDAKRKKVRLKLFDSNGRERILIKLPLEADGPMKDSLLRDTRRKTLVAVGGALEFNP